jgi:hypothetical protein
MAESTIKATNSQDARRYWLDGGNSAWGVIRQVDYAKESTGIHPSF